MVKKKQKSSITPFLMMGAGILLIVVVVIWQVTSTNQNTKLAVPLSQPTQSNISFPEVTRIALADAKAAYDSGAAVFLDVRDSDSYNSGHIPGALNFELAMLPSKIKELDPAKSIITYCTWPAEESSARAASILMENGFQNVAAIQGGFAAWMNANYPIEPWYDSFAPAWK